MKKVMLAVSLMAVSVSAAAAVGVSIGVGEPGFYGQISIGNAPAPQLIYPQPVVVAPAPQYAGAPPIYLRVPPGYAQHWGQHCAQYGACGRRVYFVQDDWYLNRYVPYYRTRRGHPSHAVRHDEHRPDGHARAYERGHAQGPQWHGDHDRARGHGDRDR